MILFSLIKKKFIFYDFHHFLKKKTSIINYFPHQKKKNIYILMISPFIKIKS